ncbi:MAG: hypothetical protein PHI71_09880, partial [Acidiphilium sp.]|nr:hypothetical protein [Acidiphilium sp.]
AGHARYSSHGAGGEKVGVRKEGYFFEKKVHKNFRSVGARAFSRARAQSQRVFWFFFAKKNNFLARSNTG